jgi:hypothetical protein
VILAAPRILSAEWMLIGRQEDTGFGGRIDLLAVAPDGALVLIEIKRDRTPREVVAQALDYASWVEKLEPDDIAAIYGRFAPGKSLADDFRQRFGHPLDEDSLNQNHQIIIVAASLDNSSERIVAYLSAQGVAVNVLCFQVFTYGADQFLSRAWLLDPVRTQSMRRSRRKARTNRGTGSFTARLATTKPARGPTRCSSGSSLAAAGRGTAGRCRYSLLATAYGSRYPGRASSVSVA